MACLACLASPNPARVQQMAESNSPANGPLPVGLTAYKRTPIFSEKTVPKGLLNNHNTKAGVWGQIHVESGTLKYAIPSKNMNHILTPGIIGTVAPEERHHIEPDGPVQFFVEFWR